MKTRTVCMTALFLVLTFVTALATPAKIAISALDDLIAGIAKKASVSEDAVVAWLKKNETASRYEFGKGNLTKIEEDALARVLVKSPSFRLKFNLSDTEVSTFMNAYSIASASAASMSISTAISARSTYKTAKTIDLKDLIDEYRTIAGQNSDKIQSLNHALIKKINHSIVVHQYSGKIENVNRSLASTILKEVSNNPIASLYNTGKYDPEGGIGFCFGRAMTAHLEAIYRDVSKDSIKKMWAVGDLRTGGTNWGWHVTTILKTADNNWLVIDPIFGQVMTIDAWYIRMKVFDFDGKMGIFFTDAPQFGLGSGKYTNDSLLDGHYNGYFKDLLEYYRNRFKRVN